MLKEKTSEFEIKSAVKVFLGERPQISKISFCRGGFFNTTVKVQLKDHTPLIVQLSPKDDSKLLWHERHMLQKAVYFLNHLKSSRLPIANILYHDFSKQVVDRDFVIFNHLSGYNWHYYGKRISLKQNELLYEQLGKYAKMIHSIKRVLSYRFGFPNKSFLKWSDFVLAYTKNLNRHNTKYRLIKIPENKTPYSIAALYRNDLDQVIRPSLVQGDLWPRNILIKEKDGEFSISGILDWERGLWGDPQFEWVLQCMNYGKSFWNAYGLNEDKFSESLICRKKLYQICFIYQAALEEIYYFKQKRKAVVLIKNMLKIIDQLQ